MTNPVFQSDYELLDVVDEHDCVVGQEVRLVIYEKNLNFRAINVFIENDKGQLWIPRRVANKRLFPLALDMSCAGHVGSGETYEQGLIRETIEELGIDLTVTPYEEVAYMTPYTHTTSAFTRVYRIRQNEVPEFNVGDFCEYYWLTPQELVALLEQGEPAKSDLIKMTRHVYGIK
jgi:isopentenyl-diphosphate delta-isomerase